VTTLISWTGVDTHGPASLYLASDSRITWGTKGAWDLGRKVFATGTAPWIMGYCGDVVFPSLLLGQLSDLIDAGLLFRPTAGLDERGDALRAAVRDGLEAYPPDQRQDFSIVFGTRVGERMQATFHLLVTTWSHAEGWAQAQIPMPATSSVTSMHGSGAAIFSESLARWGKSDAGGTSRAVFSALCDAVGAETDPHSGGAPQLVRIYRVGHARPVGVVWRGQRHVLGRPVSDSGPLDAVEWRNSVFEVCDPSTMLLKDGAQPQPRPRVI
jgi:hypothetical protein